MINKKILIPFIGVIIFLTAGAATMFLTQKTPEKIIENSEPPEKIQPEIKEPETKIKEDWYIYVTGEVKNPGVYKVSADSRIFHAVDAAGGFTAKADRNSINMAERLIDGLQIYVASKNERRNISPSQIQVQNNNFVKIPGVPQNSNRSDITASNSQNLIDVNNASAEELTRLKGVGASIAKRIIDYRNSHGKFKSAEDLINVRGIGQKTLEKMRPQILIR